MSNTTNTVKRLGYGQLTGSAATLYTCPASTKAIVKEIWFSNTDSSARTITFYAIESGGSAAANRALLSAVSIAANTVYRIPCSMVLEAGEFLQGLADTTAKVTYRISGVEVV